MRERIVELSLLHHRACFTRSKYLENACVLKNLHLGNLFDRIINFLNGNAEIIRLSRKTQFCCDIDKTYSVAALYDVVKQYSGDSDKGKIKSMMHT